MESKIKIIGSNTSFITEIQEELKYNKNSKSSIINILSNKFSNDKIRQINSFRDYLAAASISKKDEINLTNISKISQFDLEKFHKELIEIETGGFSDEKIGGQYGNEQLDTSKVMTRSIGYQALASMLQRNRKWSSTELIFDGLAGNGT